MQYISSDDVHYVISGSAGASGKVHDGKKTVYSSTDNGFSKLLYYDNGEVKLQFYSGTEDKFVYEKILFQQTYSTPKVIEILNNTNFRDSVVVTYASDKYDKEGGINNALFGKNYRETWKTGIKVPVFDIGKEKGGLKIIQRGGGMQTLSLRMEAADGKQYVLRSIEKYPENVIPPGLRGTVGGGIIADQISSSHPYGAFVVPPMAEAANVYHTNPQVVYIPDDPRFGKYQKLLGGQLALYEERVAGDQSELSNLGSSDKILSTLKVVKKSHNDSDNTIDQEWVVKSRLFDMFLADWDRHDDQWRWASFKTDSGWVYRPIPRDRDQAFFINQGFLPKLASRKWALPKLQGFDDELRWVPGFNFNARYFDRDFLNELPLESWLKAAETLQQKLTDEVIEDALKTWPEEVYALKGEEVLAKLKSQRSHLKEYAEEQYLFLAKVISVTGSNKRELFEVKRLDDEQTEVTVYRLKKSGKKKQRVYHRIIKRSETKEIRLYGLGGEDIIEITGEVKKGIKIRVIGGEDADKITDASEVSGWGKKTKVYDTKGDNEISLGKEAADFTSKDESVNDYNRTGYQYNVTSPIINIGVNPDEGVLLGGGFDMTIHGFRKDPYKQRHIFKGNISTNTSAFNVSYLGTFIEFIRPFNLIVDLNVESPNGVDNFFGFGNESDYNEEFDIDFYRVRRKLYEGTLWLNKEFNKYHSFSFGSGYQAVNVLENNNRFINNLESNGLTSGIFSSKQYLMGKLKYIYKNVDNIVYPTKGAVFNALGNYSQGISSGSSDYGSLTGDFTFYQTIRLPAKITFLGRVGGGKSFGDYEFFQAQKLSGLSEVRGFRRSRFYGAESVYSNIEARVKLFNIHTRIFNGKFGALAFHDIGRVWFDGEDSNTWHSGYGGGLWLAPLDLLIVSFTMSHSNESNLYPIVQVGFFF